jgi:hypothetical protein
MMRYALIFSLSLVPVKRGTRAVRNVAIGVDVADDGPVRGSASIDREGGIIVLCGFFIGFGDIPNSRNTVAVHGPMVTAV